MVRPKVNYNTEMHEHAMKIKPVKTVKEMKLRSKYPFLNRFGFMSFFIMLWIEYRIFVFNERFKL